MNHQTVARPPLTIHTVPAHLPRDLRERAKVRDVTARGMGDRIDAQWMRAAADEIERLQVKLDDIHFAMSEIGEPEDAWPRCDHGTPIPPGQIAAEACLDCALEE